MERLIVYADLDWYNEPQKVGLLQMERVRGNEIFSFEYDTLWLTNNRHILLDPEINPWKGQQFKKQNVVSSLFGCFADTLPDRWGRTLIKKRELISAKSEKREIKSLTDFDLLIGIDDFARMGAFRFKRDEASDFLNNTKELTIPPLTQLRSLSTAIQSIEKSELKNQFPEERWINQLLKPGSSLGGARPKATIIDNNGILWVAKFPSINDDYDMGLWEYIANRMALDCGIQVPQTRIMKLDKHHLFLSKRFDRTEDNRRIHYASAMTLLGRNDGMDYRDDISYLDITDFLSQQSGNSLQFLELFKRVAFSICINNIDDHLRNHGFLLTNKGWLLSPAFDMNPSLFGDEHKLLIDRNDNSSNLDLLLDNFNYYMIDKTVAKETISIIKHTCAKWETYAIQYGANKDELEMMKGCFKNALK